MDHGCTQEKLAPSSSVVRPRSTTGTSGTARQPGNRDPCQLQGAQIAYDVGVQRTCWQIHSLTNWMGDDGFLKSLHGQYRSHVYLSDVLRLGGKVIGKEIDATATTS